MNKPIASVTVHKVYKTYKTYKPKIIIPSSSGITSKVIDEVFKSENDARNAAAKLIEGGNY